MVAIKGTYYTKEDVTDETEYKNKVLVFTQKYMDACKSQYHLPKFQLVLASGGFGCDPVKMGSAVFAAVLADGETFRASRGDFIGVLKDELLPDEFRARVEGWREGGKYEAPPPLKGMLVSIYKTERLGDCTNGGVTATADTALLVGAGVPEIFEMSDKYPTLVLQRSPHGYVYATPNGAPKGVGWMMGGNFIYSDDSRFRADVNGYPIPVHDRTESQAQYDTLSR